jgi:hypothetical protein
MGGERSTQSRLSRALRSLLLAGTVWSAAGSAAAVDLELLVMPGPVIAGHADLEKDCGNCHRAFDADAQTGLCLDCHEEVAKDVKAKAGLHGKSSSRSAQVCRSCHPDHRGRDADVLGLSEETFDHADTDFALEGAHRATPCASCHVEDKAYREAPADCAACHTEDDRHEGRLGDACGDCHEPASWRKADFDHSKTEFPLEDAHAKADCGLCHPGDRFENVPKDCASCHGAQDVHRGKLGSACGDCHGTATWEKGSFDHDRETRFPLIGEHRSARCNDCHVTAGTRAKGNKLDRRCVTCHAKEDDHDGSFGPRCETCHSPRSWKRSLFQHKRDAHFALTGAHASLDCTSCHHGVLGKESLAKDCAECHAERDIHAGQLGKQCDTCHGSKAWSRDLAFDHDITDFPLLGLHVVAGCEDCHANGRFHDAPEKCAECHARDDAHDRRLGTDCALCHNPNGWTLWRFDHDRTTRFPLRGRHEGLNCHSCHTAPSGDTLRLSSTCGDCHGLDDPHRGGFGVRCETCHNERSWKDVRVPR